MNVLRMLVIMLIVGLSALAGREPVQASGHTYITINAPGIGTQPHGINQRGDIVGVYFDSKHAEHGFVLHQGRYTTLDYPNGSTGTQAFGINPQGDVVGYYTDARQLTHGFLWHAGKWTVLNHPKAGTRPGIGTEAWGINRQGAIVGFYVDNAGVWHGFLWQRGKWTTLDHPQAGTKGVTMATAITPQGDILGLYARSSYRLGDPGGPQGFLRHQSRYTPLKAPRQAAAHGTAYTGINASGAIVGYYVDSERAMHGFLLQQGRFTILNHPKAVPGQYQGTEVDGINPQGAIVGSYVDSAGTKHGFLWR